MLRMLSDFSPFNVCSTNDRDLKIFHMDKAVAKLGHLDFAFASSVGLLLER